jgi:imidazolonepropionase-like amidohydrolase
VMTVSHGTLRETSILIRDGKIAGVGRDIVPPRGATVIDGSEKWITPGFVDLHVHNGTDSHNESGAVNTAMVDTRDTLNPEEIGIYRTLAAGVTTANILHGSVNIIGGRTVVVKNKWGRPAAEMIFPGAKPGLKFAVKEGAPRRTASPPSSLMGVEAMLRDALTQARAYEREWTTYESAPASQKPTAPRPRRDLRLEALVEVMRGRRLLHVHCYWAEEMALVMRVAEEFGFKVRVLHHAQEAFKVAPEIARHGGGGASIFTDLIADTRYNAAILTRSGVLTSINSDGWMNARHLNQDVGRLMKFGDLSENEALALITLNPARQLEIDARVGSIEAGKDADLVVFNRYPLSVYAVPELVFIDGRVFYSRDAERERERRTRAALARVAAERAKAGTNAQ